MLAADKLTINMHVKGVLAETFRRSKALTEAFRMVATSKDAQGQEFVAWTQHRRYPIVTTQFHIEKNTYEFQEPYDDQGGAGQATPHGSEGIRAARLMAEWFTGLASK